MKHFTKLLCAALLVAMLVLQFACISEPKAEVKPVVIKVDSTVLPFEEGATLADYMNALAGRGDLTIEISDDGMVNCINGVSNTTNSFWMLYTDDAEFSNNAWGVYNLDGEELGSATLGACQLLIKDGATYVWDYQTF